MIIEPPASSVTAPPEIGIGDLAQITGGATVNFADIEEPFTASIGGTLSVMGQGTLSMLNTTAPLLTVNPDPPDSNRITIPRGTDGSVSGAAQIKITPSSVAPNDPFSIFRDPQTPGRAVLPQFTSELSGITLRGFGAENPMTGEKETSIDSPSSVTTRVVLFSDDFERETGLFVNGSPMPREVTKLDYREFRQWDVSPSVGGGVDLIIENTLGCGQDSTGGSSKCVDLAGTSGGRITTKELLTFIPGFYTLLFDVSGNQLNPLQDDALRVELGGGPDATIFTKIFMPCSPTNRSNCLPESNFLATITENLTFTDTFSVKLSFDNFIGGRDAQGPILDNVRIIPRGFIVRQLPEPGTLALFGIGTLGLLIGARRRLSSK